MNSEKYLELLEKILASLERIENIIQPGASSSTTVEFSHDVAKDVASEDKEEITEVSNKINPVESFLDTKGITVKSRMSIDFSDDTIDRLSVFLGDRYAAVKDILGLIKRSMQKGGSFAISIGNRSQKDISSITKFCLDLHKIAFIETYNYQKSPKCIVNVKTTQLPAAQAFLSGQWLERFALQKLLSAFHDVKSGSGTPQTFQYLSNPQVTLPNGDDFELDIIAVYGDTPIWIEAKSGKYQEHVNKYSALTKVLGINRSHAIMLLADADEKTCVTLSSLYPMSFENLMTFEAKIKEILRPSIEKS